MSGLVLGTAEFNPEGYAGAPPPSVKEIRKILACAKAGGIDTLDTAEAYNCRELIKKEASGFAIYTKTRNWKVNFDWGDNDLRGVFYHYKPKEKPVTIPVSTVFNLGASVYDAAQLPAHNAIVQVPMNLNTLRFFDILGTHRTVFIRSVFDRGRLLENYSLGFCLNWIKRYKVEGIIVGVKTVKELEAILKVW